MNLPHKPEEEVIKYKDLEEVSIECADCEKELFKMLKIKPSSKVHKLIVECSSCEGQSWVKELTGDYFQSTPDDLIVDEMYENEDGIMVIKMKGKNDE